MTRLYLAYSTNTTVRHTLSLHVADEGVDLLVAYPTLKNYLTNRAKYNVRNWCLDSGAFTAFNSGKPIPVQEYIAAARAVLTGPKPACEVFALDVIGDPAGTRANCEAMWKAGIKAIPTFHFGSKWRELAWCRDASKAAGVGKLAFGGVAKKRDVLRIEWSNQAMSRVWPYKVHGFGMVSRAVVQAIPFHSIDASSWFQGAAMYGQYRGVGRDTTHLPVYGTYHRDIWTEVQFYRQRGEEAGRRFAKQLRELEPSE